MAIQPKELYSAEQTDTFTRRAYPYENGTKPAQFLNVAGAPIRPVLTALVKDDSGDFLRMWVDADTTTRPIVAFVWHPEGAQLHATNETIHTVLVKGRIHRDDIPLNGQTLATFNTALKTESVLSRFDIYGIAQAGV